MRILFVNEKGAFFGGVEQHIAHAARELSERGHTCVLAYGDEAGRDPGGFRSLFSETRCLPELSASAGRTATGGWLAAAWADVTFDVVYFHKLPWLPDLGTLPQHVRTVQMVHDHDLCCPRRHKYFALTGRACGQPAGWRCYLDGAFVARDPEARFGVRLQSIADRLGEMRRHWQMDALLVGSQWMRDELLMNGAPPTRVHIVPPAVPASLHASTVAPADTDTVLYVGQLIRGKGVDRLLEALARVERPWRAVLAGQGNHEPALRRLAARLGITTRVEFAGWVAPHDLETFYQRAALVAVPSRWPEPFGMVGLEAMRHARPVVAFDVGGIGDWLEDGRTGRLVPDGRVDEYAAAIADLLSHPQRARRLGANGRLALGTRFAFPQCMDTLEGLLRGHDLCLPRTA